MTSLPLFYIFFCIKIFPDITKLYQDLRSYDQNPSLLVNDDMYIINDQEKTEAGKAIKMIYTDGMLQDDLGAGIKVNYG